MFKRIKPVLALAAAFWTAALLAQPAHATDETSHLQISRTREVPGVPGDRFDPIATPTPGDDDMPNRTVRRAAPIPQASSVDQTGSDAAPSWYRVLWQKAVWFGSKFVFFMKA